MEAKDVDRVGLSWRRELAAGIVAHLDRIDVLEVIADDLFEASDRELRALATLGRQVPTIVHGVTLGLCSTVPVDERRLGSMARVVERLHPEDWSEHLAFVRAGGIEIGHLAAPPRNAATVDGAARNLARARAVVGKTPLVENVATLLEPPGSDRNEARFVREVVEASGAGLLLDLHNLHANATNFGFDPIEFLERLPLSRVGAVHLAGGRFIGRTGSSRRRYLDDHRHDVPDPVYTLLEDLAQRTPQPLTVILERDGAFPGMEALLLELEQARAALRRGRTRAGNAAAA